MTSPDRPTLPAVPAAAAVPAHLERLVDTARHYARGAKAAATQRAYASDWRHFTAWCSVKELSPLPADPQVVGLYLSDGASADSGKASSVRTLERRLSAIT